MTLLELADRCEAAAGPDRELDQAIWLAAVADARSLKAYSEGLKIGKQEAAFRLDYMADGARHTASLDAAMTLVPEGWSFEVMRGWRCDIREGLSSAFVADKQFGPPTVHEYSDNAATPALALCAAALRARHAAAIEARRAGSVEDESASAAQKEQQP